MGARVRNDIDAVQTAIWMTFVQKASGLTPQELAKALSIPDGVQVRASSIKAYASGSRRPSDWDSRGHRNVVDTLECYAGGSARIYRTALWEALRTPMMTRAHGAQLLRQVEGGVATQVAQAVERGIFWRMRVTDSQHVQLMLDDHLDALAVYVILLRVLRAEVQSDAQGLVMKTVDWIAKARRIPYLAGLRGSLGALLETHLPALGRLTGEYEPMFGRMFTDDQQNDLMHWIRDPACFGLMGRPCTLVVYPGHFYPENELPWSRKSFGDSLIVCSAEMQDFRRNRPLWFVAPPEPLEGTSGVDRDS